MKELQLDDADPRLGDVIRLPTIRDIGEKVYANFVLLRIFPSHLGMQFQFATILDDAYRIMNFYRIDGKIRTDEGANSFNEYTGIESDSEAGIYHYSNSYFHEFVQLFSHLFQSIHSDVDLMLL